MTNCVLCDLITGKKEQTLYYEDDKIKIVDNRNKTNYDRKLLCIWKEHKNKLTDNELLMFIHKILEIREKLNKEEGMWWDIVWSMRSQPQHFHLHLAQLK